MVSSLTMPRAISQPVTMMNIDDPSSPATTAWNSSGDSLTRCGPGTNPLSDNAASSNTIDPLAGMPMPRVGISSPEFDAFWDASFAAIPSGAPRPNFSGCFDMIRAFW